jgi:hypothetical protein
MVILADAGKTMRIPVIKSGSKAGFMPFNDYHNEPWLLYDGL